MPIQIMNAHCTFYLSSIFANLEMIEKNPLPQSQTVHQNTMDEALMILITGSYVELIFDGMQAIPVSYHPAVLRFERMLNLIGRLTSS